MRKYEMIAMFDDSKKKGGVGHRASKALKNKQTKVYCYKGPLPLTLKDFRSWNPE
jgi:hypothetical protein